MSPYLENLKKRREKEALLFRKRQQDLLDRQKVGCALVWNLRVIREYFYEMGTFLKQKRLEKARESGWQNVLFSQAIEDKEVGLHS